MGWCHWTELAMIQRTVPANGGLRQCRPWRSSRSAATGRSLTLLSADWNMDDGLSGRRHSQHFASFRTEVTLIPSAPSVDAWKTGFPTSEEPRSRLFQTLQCQATPEGCRGGLRMLGGQTP